MQQNTEGPFKFYQYADPHNVSSGGVISHPTRLIVCKTDTTALADDIVLMRLDDTYAYLRQVFTQPTICNLEEF